MARTSLARATTLAAILTLGLGGLTGCGESGTAAPGDSASVVMEGDQLDGFAGQVKKMGMVEWSGQLLTKAPSNGGKQIFELSGRYSGSTGASEVSMDSSIDGKVERVDYLVINGHTYFNSEAWGPVANDCWADITGKTDYLWALPSDLDPTWPVAKARAVRLDGDGVRTGIPAATVLKGMPRGLFPTVPAGLDGIEASSLITPHGPLLEVGVDVVNMWADVPPEDLAAIDTKRAGWWSMTMKEALDDSWVAPPKHVFDPAVTPPSQCLKG